MSEELTTHQSAVIDRFEGELAVLLIGPERRVLDLPRAMLPAGAREGSYVTIELAGDQLQQIALDEQATAAARQRVQDKLARLRRGEHLKGSQ
jgi:hypothetical protein